MSANLSFFRIQYIATSVALGVVLSSAGCSNSDRASNAQSPPPQSLSEPVRPAQAEPTQTPPLTSTTGDAYANQNQGESRALPTFIAPPTAPATANSERLIPTGAKYHTLAKGETLYALSRLYNVKIKEIIEANKFKDPSHLAVGTKVCIPQ